MKLPVLQSLERQVGRRRLRLTAALSAPAGEPERPLAERFVGRLMYAPFLVQLVVTRRCNLSCGYCNEYDKDSKPVPTEVLERRIDKIAELGAYVLELTGGEPLLHPDIEHLIRYARTKSFVRVMMISNAYLLNAERVRRLNEAGLGSLQVSVDGVHPNDTTVKVLDPLRRKLEALAKHAEFEVVLSGVLGSAPPNEAVEVVRFARERGFTPRVLVLHDGEGQIELTPEEKQRYDEIAASLGRRYREAHDYRARLLATGSAPFKCRAGSRYLYVDEFGMVRWCSQTRERWGKPLLEYTHADLVEQFETPKSCAPKCTVGCVRTNSAYDEWRGQGAAKPTS